MKEREYIKATNRVKISMAMAILRDVLLGDDCGVTGKELREIMQPLSLLETQLFGEIEIEED